MNSDVNTAEITVDRLLERARAEAKERAAGQTAIHSPALAVGDFVPRTATAPSPELRVALPTWQPMRLQLQQTTQPPAKGHYSMRDLLAYDDRAFIEVAYTALLGRAPDEGGLSTYLQLLRGGTPKVEILGFLHYSPEGQSAAVRVGGLRRELWLLKLSRWPLVGALVRFCKLSESVSNLQRHQLLVEGRLGALAESAEEQSTETLGQIIRALQTLEEGNRKLGSSLAAMPSHETLRRVEASIDLVGDAVTRLHSVALKKADSNDVHRSLSEVTKSLDEVRRSLQGLQSGKVDNATLEELRKHLDLEAKATVAALDSKADRKQIGELHGQAEEARTLIIRSMDTKADRHELTALCNHLVELLEQRPTRNELVPLQRAQDDLVNQVRTDREERSSTERRLLDSVRELPTEGKMTTALQTAQTEIRVEIAAALTEVTQQLTTLSRTKADTALLEALASAKVDHDKLNASRDETRKTVTVALESAETRIRAATTAAIDEMGVRVEELSKIRAAQASIETEMKSAFAAELRSLTQEIAVLSQSKAERSALESVCGHHEAAVERLQTAWRTTLQSGLAPLHAQTRDIKSNLLDQERRLALLLEEARKRLPGPVSRRQTRRMVAEEDHLLDAMYASFEDFFRGTREEIKQRQAIYLPYIHQAKVGSNSSRLVDLGCGRGEWLELLRDAGLEAIGVDTNRVFLERCRELSLEVVENDALVYLRECKARSLGAVTSFHMIEHLPPRTLVSLLDAALHAMRPGGLLILETPNPRNVRVGSCNFYMDPTHLHPLPPDLTRYLVEARGFVNVQIKELHPSPPDMHITDGAPKVTELLNKCFFSSEDYGVIAVKP